MAPVAHSFVVTAWRDADDLLQLRADLYSLGEQQRMRRRRAVDKVRAWKVRKGELPLLLEATADLVEAGLADRRDGDEEGELGHYGLRLLYGSAISRFVTGFADTQLQLRRSKPSWYLQSRSQSQSQSQPSSPAPNSSQTPFLALPFSLLETRHSIVHREYPSLVTLKHAAQESLDWLWEWYWSRLDSVLTNSSQPTTEPLPGSTDEAQLRETLQAILKTYTRSRKQEIKQNPKAASCASSAAEVAFQACESLSNNALFHSPMVVLRTLTSLLVTDRAIIPADRKINTSMSGAFLIWTPLLAALASSTPEFLHLVLDTLIDGIAFKLSHPRKWTGTADAAANDPLCEALHAWIVQIATASSWRTVRVAMAAREVAWGRSVAEYLLETCLTSPTYWNLRTVERILKEGEVDNVAAWRALLVAAKDEDGDVEMDVDTEISEKGKTGGKVEGAEKGTIIEKLRGPQKKVGLWKRQPIGVIPAGWEQDE